MLLALEGIVQQAVSPGLVYGFWRSEQVGHPFGPFINKNHFAGWMLMTASVTACYVAGLGALEMQKRAKASAGRSAPAGCVTARRNCGRIAAAECGVCS